MNLKLLSALLTAAIASASASVSPDASEAERNALIKEYLRKNIKKHPISHIIVLMMENRSFDHLLGWLQGSGKAAVNGLTEGMSTPIDPSDPSKGNEPITRNGYDVSPDDPKHDFTSIAIQIGETMSMDGFVSDAILNELNQSNPVSMFDENSAPIINTLGQEYAIFDSWFCSLPGPTDPNRQFAMSGTSLGVITNFNGTLYPQQSYMDYLRENGRSFAGYYQDDLWALGYFEDLVNNPDNSAHIQDLDTHFYADVAAGKLPDFTWLQPRMTSSGGKVPTWQHPDASVMVGEQLIKEVYEAVRASPIWNETLLLITYDEHGGFYDHVTPPYSTKDEATGESNFEVPAPDSHVASNGFQFDQLGVRIPTVAISPWIPRGTVVTDPLPNEQPTATSAFDATSALATANIILGLAPPPGQVLDEEERRQFPDPLGARMAWANTFAGLTSLDAPRDDADCPKTLPDLPLDAATTATTTGRAAAGYSAQREKPLNDHLRDQLLYYCVQNYAQEHARGECPGLQSAVTHNQGTASDWLAAETAVFVKKLRSRERVAAAAKASAASASV